MRRASPLALAALLALTASPLAALPVAATQVASPRFPVLPEDSAKTTTKLTVDGRYIVELKPGRDVDKAKGKALGLGVKADKTYRYALKGYSAHLNRHQLAALAADPDVQEVVPDEIFTIQGQTKPTGVRRVNATESTISRINGTDGDTASGERVDADVAIVDTGIDKNNPDLNVVGGVSCSTDNPNAWGDPNGHGTHVSGIVGALDNGIGVVGVAPGVRLWAVRILNSAGDGLLSWYVCGLDWITAQRDPQDPSRPLIEAVNMSVAKAGTDDNNCGNTNNDVIHQAICRLVASGVTVVAAAGNNHFNAANLKPASYNEVITVSALADTDGRPGGLGGPLCYSWGGYDKDDTFADFSNYGADVDIIAPGKCIYSTLPGGRYGYMSGTSMAAPHVTAAAAIYKSSRPDATPAEVRAALRAAGNMDWNTATDPDSMHEPLLDVSHLVNLGDFAVDATPFTSHGTLANASGVTATVPVSLIRAEDFASEIDLSIDSGSPFNPSLDDTKLTGADQVSANLTFTVPPDTASGNYVIRVRATDGTRDRTSLYPITVDSDPPTASAPVLRLLAGAKLGATSTGGAAAWVTATDPGGGPIAGYDVRWRVDGTVGPQALVGGGASAATRSMLFGHTYSLRIRARDAAGNWGPWVESGSYKPVLTQITSTAWLHSGHWQRTVAPVFSAGSAMTSSQVGAAVGRRFTGRAIALVASKGPDRGIAKIYLDGALAANVNLNRSSTAHQVVVYTARWSSPGVHRIKIVIAGRPNHSRLDADALVIVP